MKKIIISIAIALATVAGVAAIDQAINPASARDCSANAVAKCGVWSVSEMRNAYNNDTTPGLRNIFNGMGLSTATVNSATVKEGYVHKDGRVTIGNEVVATGAVSAGRQITNNQRTKHTHNGTVYYTSPASQFGANQYAAYIFLDKDGRFIGAVLLDCGNPIKATPPKPKPVPSAVCSALEATVVNRTTVRLTGRATVANGATISGYVFTVTGANGQTVASRTVNSTAATANTELEVTAPGTYTAKVVVKTSLGDKTAAACEKQFTVEREKTPGVDIVKKVDGQDHKEVAVDQTFTYQLKVTNTGETDLTNVKVTDDAPAHVQFLSADKGTITNNKWSHTIPTLKVGESATFAITAKVTKEVPGRIKNTACVDAPAVPGNPDDCDDATVEVPPTPEVPVIKVCDRASKTIITIRQDDFDEAKHSTNFEDCKEVPVTPPTPEAPKELPTTGLGNPILNAIALSTLVGSVVAYSLSRRTL